MFHHSLSASRHLAITAVIIVLIVLFLIPGVTVPVSASGTGQVTPEETVRDAWEKAKRAPCYNFRVEIRQAQIPLPGVQNVGREASVQQFYLEGESAFTERRMELTLWSNGGNVLDPDSGVAIWVEGDRTYVRQGGRDWEETGSLTGVFAPENDLLAYLAAATNLQLAGSEDGIDRYTFTIDGPGFARYVRDQMQARLSAEGELPPGLELDLPAVYDGMQGTGEVWIDASGYPIRQILHLQFPPQKGARIEAEIKADFSGFVDQTSFIQPGIAITSAESSLQHILARMSGVNGFDLRTALPGVALAAACLALFIILHRSRKLQVALAGMVIASMVLTPLWQGVQAATFTARQRERLAKEEAFQEESNLSQTLKEMQASRQRPVPAGPEALTQIAADDGSDRDGDGLTDVQELFLQTNPASPQTNSFLDREPADPEQLRMQGISLSQLDPNDPSDRDEDGLTDYQEILLGTSSSLVDSDGDGIPDGWDTDGDGISDGDEVRGFLFEGKQYYSDPLEVDTNKDGLDDGREWNRAEAFHATWDLDGDKIPDILDIDDDGDQVPDRVDISPHQAGNGIFTSNQPFSLQLSGLEPGRAVYLDLQIRPDSSGIR